jgi:hypothetical protein
MKKGEGRRENGRREGLVAELISNGLKMKDRMNHRR